MLRPVAFREPRRRAVSRPSLGVCPGVLTDERAIFGALCGDGRTAASRADLDPILLRGELALRLAHGGMARVELAHAVWLLSSWREEASTSA
jgi:hypothetical protein